MTSDPRSSFELALNQAGVFVRTVILQGRGALLDERSYLRGRQFHRLPGTPFGPVSPDTAVTTRKRLNHLRDETSVITTCVPWNVRSALRILPLRATKGERCPSITRLRLRMTAASRPLAGSELGRLCQRPTNQPFGPSRAACGSPGARTCHPALALVSILKSGFSPIEGRLYLKQRRFLLTGVIHEPQLVDRRVDPREEYRPTIASRAQAEPCGAPSSIATWR